MIESDVCRKFQATIKIDIRDKKKGQKKKKKKI